MNCTVHNFSHANTLGYAYNSVCFYFQEFQDVQEQLRDVMFYFEAQQKLSETTEATQDEIKESHIVVQSGATGGSGGLKRGRKKGGRQ